MATTSKEFGARKTTPHLTRLKEEMVWVVVGEKRAAALQNKYRISMVHGIERGQTKTKARDGSSRTWQKARDGSSHYDSEDEEDLIEVRRTRLEWCCPSLRWIPED